MVRPLRLEYPGAVYHVMSRGDARKSITRSQNDKPLFLEVLNEAREKYNIFIHGYCLMTNHYHLLIETPDGNLSMAMRHINGVYTQRSNARNKTIGHIFQGRYKAILVDKDEYLLCLCRYIELNPVRAGLVASPEEWAWSSFRQIAGIDKRSALLETDWILSQFGESKRLARGRYISYVTSDEAADDKPFEKMTNRCILGSEGFVRRFDESIWQKDEIVEIARKHRHVNKPTLPALFQNDSNISAEDRDRLIWEAVYDFGYRQKEVADHLGLHYASVCRVLREKNRMLRIKT
jgi:putative transposase